MKMRRFVGARRNVLALVLAVVTLAVSASAAEQNVCVGCEGCPTYNLACGICIHMLISGCCDGRSGTARCEGPCWEVQCWGIEGTRSCCAN
jgi:hypothetical protein